MGGGRNDRRLFLSQLSERLRPDESSDHRTCRRDGGGQVHQGEIRNAVKFAVEPLKILFASAQTVWKPVHASRDSARTGYGAQKLCIEPFALSFVERRRSSFHTVYRS